MNKMDKTSNRYYVPLIYLALALVTLAVFSQVRNYDFINLDDLGYVFNNPNVQAGLTRDSIVWAFTMGYKAYWHPLTWLSYMLDCQLFGTDPGWHHLTNLLLHITSTLLLFAVFRRMTGLLWRSAFVAALFALHPLNVESVAWISERKNVLSTMFWMLTMITYLGYVQRATASRYLLTLLMFALGLMAKPMLVTLPFVLLLLDYWPLGRLRLSQTVRGGRKPGSARFQWRLWRRLVGEKVPFLALSAVSIYLSSLSVQTRGIVVSTEAVPMGLRIANAMVSYVSYIAKMLWPWKLAVFYPYPETVPAWQVIGALLLLAGVSVLVFRLVKSKPYLAVGWLWYLGTLTPAIGIMQAGSWPAMADRFAYIPLVGLFIIIALGLPELLRKWRYQKTVLTAAALAVILTLSICTHLQLLHWRNSGTVFEHAVKVTDGNYLAHFYLARSLSEEGRVDEAITHLEEVLRLRPGNVLPLNALAWLLATNEQTKFHNPQRAIRLAQHACRITKHTNPGLLDTLAVAYAAAGRFSEAVATAEKALELAESADRKELIEQIKNRLNLYKTGQPYIEELKSETKN